MPIFIHVLEKVLILAYYYPPCNLPASNRAAGWAGHLHAYGVYPVIVTRSWDNPVSSHADTLKADGKETQHSIEDAHETCRLPYRPNLRDRLRYKGPVCRIFARALSLFERLAQNWCTSVLPYKNIYHFADRYLKENPDTKALIVTANPFTLFHFGHKLAKKHKIPWIADYRDDWNTTELYSPRGIERIISYLEGKSEKRWLANAACFTTISAYYRNKIANYIDKTGHVILNGYFPEELPRPGPVRADGPFTITYSGTLYPTQALELFCDGFRKFVDMQPGDNHSIELLFSGLKYEPAQEARLLKALGKYASYLKSTARVEKKKALEQMQRSHVLLLLSHQGLKGVAPSKLFEYIALERQILVVPDDKDIIKDIVKDTQSGLFADTPEQVAQILQGLYTKWARGEDIRPQSRNTEDYTREKQAEKLAGIVKAL